MNRSAITAMATEWTPMPTIFYRAHIAKESNYHELSN